MCESALKGLDIGKNRGTQRDYLATIQDLRYFVQYISNTRTGVGFDCLFLFKLVRDYVNHMLTICVLLFGSKCAYLDICP
jgi:hypothetical protein